MLITILFDYYCPGDLNSYSFKMKFTLATIALFAGLAVALPAGNLNANQDAADAKNTNQKANANANAAANDGSGVC